VTSSKRAFAAVFVAALVLAAPTVVYAQRAVVRGVVTDAAGGPLAYSVVSVGSSDRQLLTDDSGKFVFSGLVPGSYHLRARHLGFLPLDTLIDVRADGAGRLELRLTHLTVQLSEMRVVVPGPCIHPGPPDPRTEESLAAVFGQLRENADRAITLGQQFPFLLQMERRSWRTARGDRRPMGLDTVVVDGGARWPYRRGQMISVVNDRGKAARQFNIPGLAQLADSAFHNAHCFTYGGVETIKGQRYIRVDFHPDVSMTTADIEGSAWLDPDSYQLMRMVMSMTHPEAVDPNMFALKVTSSFREIVSAIAILDTVEGVTSFEMPQGGTVVHTEQQKRVSVVFTRGAPPPGAALQ